MAAWRYEISLIVLKKYFTRSLRSQVKCFSTLEEKFRISVRPCNILYLSGVNPAHTAVATGSNSSLQASSYGSLRVGRLSISALDWDCLDAMPTHFHQSFSRPAPF